MTTPWTQPGLTPEERADALLAKWIAFKSDTMHPAIAAAIRAAVEAETERIAALLLLESGAHQTEAERLGIDTEPAIRAGMIRDALRGMAASIRTTAAAKEGM